MLFEEIDVMSETLFNDLVLHGSVIGPIGLSMKIFEANLRRTWPDRFRTTTLNAPNIFGLDASFGKFIGSFGNFGWGLRCFTFIFGLECSCLLFMVLSMGIAL